MKNDVNTGNKDVVTDNIENAVTSDLDVVADAINEVVTNNSSIVTSDEIDEKKLARKKSTLKSQAKRYILNFCYGEEFQELFNWIQERFIDDYQKEDDVEYRQKQFEILKTGLSLGIKLGIYNCTMEYWKDLDME